MKLKNHPLVSICNFPPAGLTILAMLMIACNPQIDQQPFQEVLEDHCPGADILEFEPKEDYVEIGYECEGKLFEIAMDYRQNLIYSETDTEISDEIRGKIDKKLEKKYAGWSLDEYALIEMGDTAFYKFELIRDGVEQNVYFTLDGKYFQRSGFSAINNEVFAELAQTAMYRDASYDFLNPARIYDLPDLLIEISGIALADSRTIYCVQDELGAVFAFDLESGEVEDVIRFTYEGDFEGVAIGANRVYALRSDGKVFHFKAGDDDREIGSFTLSMDCPDAEGLYYNPSEHSLYVACKASGVNEPEDERTVYRFNADSPSESTGSFTIDVNEINDFIDNNFPDADVGEVVFNPSGFSIHPQTGDRYLLSATDRLLVVYKKDDLKSVFLLPEELYYKPEGITFSQTGDLFFSSEGVKNGPIPGQIYHLPRRN